MQRRDADGEVFLAVASPCSWPERASDRYAPRAIFAFARKEVRHSPRRARALIRSSPSLPPAPFALRERTSGRRPLSSLRERKVSFGETPRRSQPSSLLDAGPKCVARRDPDEPRERALENDLSAPVRRRARRIDTRRGHRVLSVEDRTRAEIAISRSHRGIRNVGISLSLDRSLPEYSVNREYSISPVSPEYRNVLNVARRN